MKATIPARPALMALAGLTLAAAALLWLPPGGLELTISERGDGGRVLWSAPLMPGEPFTIYYHHSVNHLPIWEEHRADENGRIFMETERFISFNAGMGHLPGQGDHHDLGDGRQEISGLHRPVGRLVLRVGGPAVGHTILWRSTSTNLSAVAAGRAVEIRARPVSLARRWWRILFPHPQTPSSGS